MSKFLQSSICRYQEEQAHEDVQIPPILHLQISRRASTRRCPNSSNPPFTDIKKSKHKKMSKFLQCYGGKGGMLTLKVRFHNNVATIEEAMLNHVGIVHLIEMHIIWHEKTCNVI
jgi:hypothetical protein